MEYSIVTVYDHNKDKFNLVQYRKEQLFLDGFFSSSINFVSYCKVKSGYRFLNNGITNHRIL